MSDQIKEGDTVQIMFSGECLEGVVLSIPQATGDCWRIRDSHGHLKYVQQFIYMTKLEKKDGIIPF